MTGNPPASLCKTVLRGSICAALAFFLVLVRFGLVAQAYQASPPTETTAPRLKVVGDVTHSLD